MAQADPVFISGNHERAAPLIHIYTIFIQIGSANIFGATYNDFVITVLTATTFIPRGEQEIIIAFPEDKRCFNSSGASTGVVLKNGAFTLGNGVPLLRLSHFD